MLLIEVWSTGENVGVRGSFLVIVSCHVGRFLAVDVFNQGLRHNEGCLGAKTLTGH